MQRSLTILKKPLITERATALKAASNQYVFRVAPHAGKQEIKQAIEDLFKVKVLGVNTMNVRGKYRRMGQAPGAYRPSWKKAIVSVKPGQEIRYMDEPK
jgi:large subunit ribosomal protein L23